MSKTTQLLKQMTPKVSPIMPDMIIPNHSGEHKGLDVRDRPVVLKGTARVYKTLQIPAGSAKASGANPATFVSHGLDGAWEYVKGGINQISSVFAVRPDMDITEIPVLKIFWSSPAITGDVLWEVQYLWRCNNEDTSSTTPTGTVEHLETVSTTANGLTQTEFILGLPDDEDCICQIRISRLGDDVTDTADDVSRVMGFAVRYVSNRLGIPI